MAHARRRSVAALYCTLLGFLPATCLWAQTSGPGEFRSVHTRARAVTQEALAAMASRDTAAARLRWEDALRADPSDPMPVFALAALERFTYKPEAAEHRYRGILGDDPDLGDPIRLEAALCQQTPDSELPAKPQTETIRMVGADVAAGVEQVKRAAGAEAIRSLANMNRGASAVNARRRRVVDFAKLSEIMTDHDPEPRAARLTVDYASLAEEDAADDE